MRAAALALFTALAAAGPAPAELLDSPEDRAAFGAELRALLLEEPEILDRALNPPMPGVDDIYADEIAADLARIDAEAPALFDAERAGVGPEGAPVAMALVTGPDCPDCTIARDEAENLARALDIRVVLVDLEQPGDAALVSRLGLDLVPSYVLPDMMVRGHVPPFVLERYLTE